MTKILEIKHEVTQPVLVKTRGVGTLIAGTNPNVANQVLAKVGVSPPPECRDHNKYFVDLFLNRFPGMKVMVRPFPSVRDQWIKMMDVFQMEREITASLEYDFKRRPVNACMISAGDSEHLAFETVPWTYVEEGELARTIFDGWRRSRCLKTYADWEDWQDHYLTVVTLDNVRKNLKGKRLPLQVTDEGSVGILKRTFLRAYAREAWGLKRTMKYAELLQTLERIGFPVTPHDAKNGNKGVLMTNIVPWTPRTERLWDQLVLAFDGLDSSQFFFSDTK